MHWEGFSFDSKIVDFSGGYRNKDNISISYTCKTRAKYDKIKGEVQYEYFQKNELQFKSKRNSAKT